MLPVAPEVIRSYREFRERYDYHDPNYTFYYKFIKRPISYPLTWWVYKNTTCGPNIFTYIGFAFAFLAAFLFSQGTYGFLIAGFIAFFIYELFDDFDGVIARSKNIRSRRGGWLDILAGTIGKTMLIAGISIGAFRVTQDPRLLIVGVIALVGYSAYTNLDHVTKIRFSVVVQKKLKFEETKPDPNTLAGKISILSEILMNLWPTLLIICTFSNAMPFLVYYTAAYYTVYPVTLFFYLNRKYKNV